MIYLFDVRLICLQCGHFRHVFQLPTRLGLVDRVRCSSQHRHVYDEQMGQYSVAKRSQREGISKRVKRNLSGD